MVLLRHLVVFAGLLIFAAAAHPRAVSATELPTVHPHADHLKQADQLGSFSILPDALVIHVEYFQPSKDRHNAEGNGFHFISPNQSTAFPEQKKISILPAPVELKCSPGDFIYPAHEFS